jgi:hypothetical protein
MEARTSSSGALPNSLRNAFSRSIASATSARRTSSLRHNPSDRFAVAGDANCPASFHLIEKLGELRFGVGRLEFEKVSYGFDQLLGRVKHTALFAAALRMLHAAATSS